MRKFIIVGLIFSSSLAFADDAQQKKAIAQKLVSVDGTEQGLQNTDKMILEQIRMRLPKDLPESFYTDLSKNLNSEQRKQFIVQRYAESFSEKELQAALNFYQTAEGKAWAKKASDVGTEVAHFTTQNARHALNATMQQYSQNPKVKQLIERMNPATAQTVNEKAATQ